MLSDDSLASRKGIRLKDLKNRSWVLLSHRVSPYSYDMIQIAASDAGVMASELHHVMTAEQTMSFIMSHDSIPLKVVCKCSRK